VAAGDEGTATLQGEQIENGAWGWCHGMAGRVEPGVMLVTRRPEPAPNDQSFNTCLA
jgi:hypothetical protein